MYGVRICISLLLSIKRIPFVHFSFPFPHDFTSHFIASQRNECKTLRCSIISLPSPPPFFLFFSSFGVLLSVFLCAIYRCPFRFYCIPLHSSVLSIFVLSCNTIPSIEASFYFSFYGNLLCALLSSLSHTHKHKHNRIEPFILLRL